MKVLEVLGIILVDELPDSCEDCDFLFTSYKGDVCHLGVWHSPSKYIRKADIHPGCPLTTSGQPLTNQKSLT